MSASCKLKSCKQKTEIPHLWKLPPDHNDDGRRNPDADEVILPADICEASGSTLEQG